MQGSEAIKVVAAPILSKKSETSKTPTIPIIKSSEVSKQHNGPEVIEDPEPQIKSIPDIKENIIIENDEDVKKYVPQIKLVEEPEIPPMTTSTPVTAAPEAPEKEARTYKSMTAVVTKEATEVKDDEYINPLLDKNFPNFFTRFQKIFGDTQNSFFVKL